MKNNQVTGTIATEFGLLTSMKEIQFSNMALTGTIPSEIGHWSTLKKIFLHDTNIEGKYTVVVCANIL